MSANKIPFGLKNEILIGVSEVVSGLACGCVCPSCHRKLQANKGKKVSHYFSHDPSQEHHDCESAFETSIHLMAKQIISESSVAVFPEFTVKASKIDMYGKEYTVQKKLEKVSRRMFETVKLEKQIGEIRPDIIAYADGVPFLIEIAVSHFSDKKKKEFIRNKSLPAIEINLSKVLYETTKEELKKLVIDDIENKKWLSHPSTEETKKELNEELDAKIKKINEHFKRQQKKMVQNFQQNVAIPRYSKSFVCPKKNNSKKEYDTRWFLCEACRHTFSESKNNAPYTIDTIECLECGYSVYAKPR